MPSSRPAKRARTEVVDLTAERDASPPSAAKESAANASIAKATATKAPAKRAPAKRAPAKRASAARKAPIPPISWDITEYCNGIRKEVELLSLEEMTEFIANAAVESSRMLQRVREICNRKTEARRSEVHTFSDAAKSVWRSLNGSNARGSGSRQYEASFDAKFEITDVIMGIVSQATPRQATNLQTMKNAMEALRKVGKTICMSAGSALVHEVHMDYQCPGGYDPLVKAMHSIVKEMTEEEMAEVWESHNDKDEEFGEKLVELRVMAKQYCLFEGLDNIIAALGGNAPDSSSLSSGSSSGDDE